jgi:hypothetical protein
VDVESEIVDEITDANQTTIGWWAATFNKVRRSMIEVRVGYQHEINLPADDESRSRAGAAKR